MVGSAENLVGRVLNKDLGKYVDSDLVRATQRELAEACNLTQDGKHCCVLPEMFANFITCLHSIIEMERAANRLIEKAQSNRKG